MGTPPSELVELAEQARQQRLDGDHHNGVESEFPLVGYCFDNAYVLYKLLSDAGYTPYIVEGTTDRVADELIQNDVDPLSLDSTVDLGGLVHYWVEVGVDGTTWYIDIASDTWDQLGEVVLTDTLPAAYMTLPNSHVRGKEIVRDVEERGDRCTRCGDHAYTEGGCQKCAELLSSDLER